MYLCFTSDPLAQRKDQVGEQCLLHPNLHLAAFERKCSMSNSFRYEVDKLTASQRLDLNLEKGRIRDELQSLRDMATEMEIKVRWAVGWGCSGWARRRKGFKGLWLGGPVISLPPR